MNRNSSSEDREGALEIGVINASFQMSGNSLEAKEAYDLPIRKRNL